MTPTELFESCHNAKRSLPMSMAFKHKVPGMDLEDVKQELLLALWKAAHSYDPSKGAKFVTHAFWTLRGCISNLMAHAVSERFGGKAAIVSLDVEVPGDSTGHDAVPDEMVCDPRHEMLEREKTEALHFALSKLTPGEHALVVARLQGKTFKEIGAQYGITRQAVERYNSNAMAKLRRYAARYMK